MERELQRNIERYRFMKWATRSLKGVRVHPPGTGIMHDQPRTTGHHCDDPGAGRSLGPYPILSWARIVIRR